MTVARALQRFMGTPGARRAPAEACELCGVPLGGTHSHVVDLERRVVCCACRACALLFTEPGAARGRYRTVPDRVLTDPGFSLAEDQWTALGVPVRLAFIFFNSKIGRWVALYPSPAGATEAELPQEEWARVAGESPLLGEVQPDVEALLLQSPRGTQRFECFLAPIDACYELVGRIRRTWKGFDGGDDARQAIDSFFQALRQRSQPLRRQSRPGGSP